MHVNCEAATITHTHKSYRASFSLLICNANSPNRHTDFRLSQQSPRGRKTTEGIMGRSHFLHLELWDEDNDPFLSPYLEYELFEEEKHEGSERDDLLLRWPWSV